MKTILILSLLSFVSSSLSYSFWVITDWHINNFWMDGNTRLNTSLGNVLKLCNDYTEETELRPGKYSSFGCSSNLELWKTTLSHMKNVNPHPNFIMWLGDNHGHVQEPDTENLVLGSTSLLKDMVEETFPNIPVLPAIGNHDTYPYDSDPGSEYYTKLCSYWKQWLTPDELINCNNNGTFSTKISNLRLLSINTQHLTLDIINYIETVFKQSKLNNEFIYIGAHIPLGPASCFKCDCSMGFEGGCWNTDFQTKFLDLVSNYSDIIKGIFHGHTHTDEFRVLFKDGLPSNMIYIIPSLPPYNPDTNPSVRMFEYDNEYNIIDYKQHWLELTASNKLESPLWQYYSPKNLYKMPDLSPHSWMMLEKTFEVNDDMFQVYYQAFNGFPSIFTKCDSQPDSKKGCCKGNLMCPMFNITPDEYSNCLNFWNNIDPPIKQNSTLLYIAIVVCVCMVGNCILSLFYLKFHYKKNKIRVNTDYTNILNFENN